MGKISGRRGSRLARNKPPEPAAGYITANYLSGIDDSEQPFALWVPRSYSASRSYPLIVALHGTDADERMIPEGCFCMHQRGFREDIIFLSVLGRGDLCYEWMGEADLWDAMNWVKSRYHIDARRQYLTGLSMGGFACWRLACQYPEQWAAIAPVCGGGDPALLPALGKMPVWCVHGEHDKAVPVGESRRLIAAMQKLKLRPRYDELKGWGHNSWEWIYDPGRKRDSLADWFLQFRKTKSPPPIPAPRRRGVFKDLFSERVVISYPVHSAIPREVAQLRAEAEQIARFSFGDAVMRRGHLILKSDAELSVADLRSANQLMLGRDDNHRWLKKAGRRLLARHARGRLVVGGQSYLGKTLIAATVQTNPWNKKRLLGIITYQQFQQMRGMAARVCGPESHPLAVNLYDTQQKRFIRREMAG